MSYDVVVEIHRYFNDANAYYSISQIGEALGLTKGQVVGIINRQRRMSDGLHFPEREVPPGLRSKTSIRAVEAKPKPLPRGTITPKPVIVAPPPSPSVEERWPAPVVAEPKQRVTKRTCTFVISHQRSGPTVCEDDTEGHRSYCPKHQVVMYGRKPETPSATTGAAA